MNHFNFKDIPLQSPFKLSTQGSLRVLLLHGNLDICVKQANNLPNMDMMFHNKLGHIFGSHGHVPRETSDPYVTISISHAVIARTFVIKNNENPVWNQHFNVPIAHHTAEVKFVVKDDDVVGSQEIGAVVFTSEQIYSGLKVEGVYPILNSSGKVCRPGASLSLSIQYIPIEKFYGIGAGSGVPGTYFPLRPGGKVTLYQDAHVHEPSLPKLKLDYGIDYVHGHCWNDIYDSISQARRLIYITGWSIFPEVKLVREDDGNAKRDLSLGDLLIRKSQEGVRVLLLVWDDPTSHSLLGIKKEGIMKTSDEVTRQFFKHSSVKVLLCPRSAGKGHSWVKKREGEIIYTHHQKTVIVDADAGFNRRKIIAFIGGLDLCFGRYDTPFHPLLRTRITVHKDDFHNPNFTGSSLGCPREPWHDLHSKIEGPAAYDILTNFQERWLRSSSLHRLSKIKRQGDDALLKIESIHEIIGMNDLPCLKEDDPLGWHVQIFRSIDSNSVKGFPKDPKEATLKNLACGKNVLIDMSIHSAYVKAIRSAQHFIYIENQYFLGSSYNWENHKDKGINNLIPMEIALKIANKIRGKQRFAAYIVIPMYPEGGSTHKVTQRILYWQNKTMQMMYDVIYNALQEVGLDNQYEPQDYLNFFCLGNRETQEVGDVSDVGKHVPKNSPQFLAQKNRRFMIYVHSKGMIVDDEYVILGSANINQRSLDGSRDTEIAMGAYQPQFTWAKKGSKPFGQIYGYRMSLWAEHTGVVEDCFVQPENIECVQRVRAMGEHNWRLYAGEDLIEMTGHLLKYPVQVDWNGKVRSIPGCETFPDVGGNILGTFIPIQENITL
ncbi:phospholipase D beta 1-like isoform X1 [Impatiens glandulifera]|uniref:phospholipase D beta 1-like isoform X1 n=1 Tax=Impatiens glandulifera TaxID=253017 RepID=UPI001FB109FB|nr:phospholipase D beta 1-like isoform X1 [Impatiens glandulifera]